MRIMVNEVRYASNNAPFIGTFKPYMHQQQTLEIVRDAIKGNKTICIENTSMTGSGKTLANFAAAILDGVKTCGVYPTNELLADQYGSIYKYLQPNIAILDSLGLEDIMEEQIHMRTHAHALAWATEQEQHTAVLTNPDVLYLAMYDLYGHMFTYFNRSFGARVFRSMISQYPVIALDEFHLYNAKQIASTAFMIGTARKLAPERPHIFIFSSATPQTAFRQYVEERLGIEILSVTNPPSAGKGATVVCEPIEVTIVPGDLMRWRGGDVVQAELDAILKWADSCTPAASGVWIVDSVYEAKCIADTLRERYPADQVGEIHGYMDELARGKNLQCRFSVGTTTIDVGVDFTGKKAKDFLICEARSPAQAIQRLGRLGRQGREPGSYSNRAWIIVPDYVHEYMNNRCTEDIVLSRNDFNALLNEAYLFYENFAAYTQKYSPLEAVAASERIIRQPFADISAKERDILHFLVPTLYDKHIPENQEQAEMRYQKYRKTQKAIWSKFGTEIKNPGGKSRQYYLSDLESFRGGMGNDFTVAIYDELDLKLGMKPVKTYNLPFVLRRTQCEELSKQNFIELIRGKHPAEAEQWLQDLQRENVLGYVSIQGLLKERPREVFFEIPKPSGGIPFHEVVRLHGFTCHGSGLQLHTTEDSINGRLKKMLFNCWISERKSFQLSASLRLPPLFHIYPLHALNVGGSRSEWSVAFGLDAFFLESVRRNLKTAKRRDNTAFIL